MSLLLMPKMKMPMDKIIVNYIPPPVGIKIKLDEGAEVPLYGTVGSAGCDVRALEGCTIEPGERCLVPTGVSLELPSGWECQIRPRSGLALRHGITVLNSPSTIDSDFRGAVCILLYNASDRAYIVEKGERIAQFVFAPVSRAEFIVVDELSETSRGIGGFGSTGKQ